VTGVPPGMATRPPTRVRCRDPLTLANHGNDGLPVSGEEWSKRQRAGRAEQRKLLQRRSFPDKILTRIIAAGRLVHARWRD